MPFNVTELLVAAVLLGLNWTAFAARIDLSALPIFTTNSIRSDAPAPSPSDNSSSVQQACAQLYRQIGYELLEPVNGSLYEQSADAHWSSTAWEHPSCIFSPRSTDDVSLAMGIIGQTGASFAIRGGGHSPNPGWASINGGLLVSMTNLKDFAYSETAQTVRFGVGYTWGEVYNMLEEYGQLVVGGRVISVGMGLLLGGGLSHLSNQYGLAVENTVSFDIVLANASSVVASQDQNPDLFWAMKGGGNNFGVVTHITMKTYAVGETWGGVLVYNASQADQVIAAIADYQAVGQLDVKSAIISYFELTNSSVYVTLIYLEPVERPSCFQPFYNIPVVEDMTALHPNFTDLIGQPIDKVEPRYAWAATSYALDVATYVEVMQLCQNSTLGLHNLQGASLVPLPQPISLTMIEPNGVPGNYPMNIQAVPQLWLNLNLGWELESDDAFANSFLVELIADIEALTKTRNVYLPYLFMNDAHYSQQVIAHYGQQSQAAMLAVSKAYDPNGVFQTQAPGGFKISQPSNL